MRLLSGIPDEPSWIVQAAIISKYLPQRYESVAFGTCMAIATSANLIGYFVIPIIMKDVTLLDTRFTSRFQLSLWLSAIVSGFSLLLFLLFCIPLYKMGKRKTVIAKKLETHFEQEPYSNI